METTNQKTRLARFWESDLVAFLLGFVLVIFSTALDNVLKWQIGTTTMLLFVSSFSSAVALGYFLLTKIKKLVEIERLSETEGFKAFARFTRKILAEVILGAIASYFAITSFTMVSFTVLLIALALVFPITIPIIYMFRIATRKGVEKNEAKSNNAQLRL